ERHQCARLQALFGEILPQNKFYSRKFGRCRISPGDSHPPLANLPFTTKSELVADQAEQPPYGSILTYPRERYTRLHQTSGTSTGRPLRWLDTPESWQWMLDCWRQKFAIMRLTPADRVCFAF